MAVRGGCGHEEIFKGFGWDFCRVAGDGNCVRIRILFRKSFERRKSGSCSRIDLKLPGEVEKSIITVDEVEAKILEIGELATCEGDYTVTRGKDFTRYFVDKIPIPGSTNHVELTCTGIVKAGYSLEDIAVRVDNESMKIYVALPQAKIMSNQLIWDSVVCNEQNSMLNPIDFEQYQTLISEIESEGLEEVQKKGFFDTVESNAKKLIGNFLGCFADYTVEFI